jgi:hypothetical protein
VKLMEVTMKKMRPQPARGFWDWLFGDGWGSAGNNA